MPGIMLDVEFSDPTLPSAADYAAQIKAIPNLVGWFQADAVATVVEANEVVQFNDLGGSSAIFATTQDIRRADLESAQLGTYSAAHFRTAQTGESDGDVYRLENGTFDTNSPYTIVAVFQATDNSDGSNILARYQSSTERSILNISTIAEEVRLQHGAATIAHSITLNEWSFVIAAFDGTDLHLYGDGVTYTPVTVTSGNGGLVSQFCLGAVNTEGASGFDGRVSDIMLIQGVLFDDAARLSAVLNYMNLTYGL